MFISLSCLSKEVKIRCFCFKIHLLRTGRQDEIEDLASSSGVTQMYCAGISPLSLICKFFLPDIKTLNHNKNIAQFIHVSNFQPTLLWAAFQGSISLFVCLLQETFSSQNMLPEKTATCSPCHSSEWYVWDWVTITNCATCSCTES